MFYILSVNNHNAILYYEWSYISTFHYECLLFSKEISRNFSPQFIEEGARRHDLDQGALGKHNMSPKCY